MHDIDLDALEMMSHCTERLSTRAALLLAEIEQLEQLLVSLREAVGRISGERSTPSAGNLALVKAPN